MAKEVDLTGAKPKAPSAPQPVPLGGVTGTVPLPVGHAVRAVRPKGKLTAMETEKLKELGWEEGEAFPANMAQIIADAEKAAKEEADGPLPPPIDPITPPTVVPDPVDIGTLPPDQQRKVRQQIDEAMHGVPPRQPAAAATAPPTAPPTAAPSGNVLDAVAAASEESREAQPGKAAAQPGKAAAQPEEPELDMGLQTHCPHCSWDLAQPDIAEPGDNEKSSFLQTVLGQRVFTKEYSILGDEVQVTFRSLTTREIDAIYKQAYKERDGGKILTEMDFWERVNRLRLYLQLARLQSSQFLHDMPDGFIEETSPNASQHWKLPDDADQPLLLVENYILNNVLTSESLNRVVQMICGRFNRLVARLEALVDNSDFWKKTRSPA